MIIRTHYRSFRHVTSRILVRSIAAWIALQSAHAASGTWLNAGAASGVWSNVSNWSGGIVPGSTVSTTNADTVTFNNSVGTFGSAGSPILFDAGRNLKTVNFTGAAGSYFVGATTGSPLSLSSGGAIQLSGISGANVIQTINAPLVLRTTAAFSNNSANGSGAGAGTLNFRGGITFGIGTTFTVSGSNANANTISGVIANGSATTVSFVKSGSGTWMLAGLNTFNATVQISEGTLGINSIADGGSASSLGAGTGSIALGSNATSAKLQFSGTSGGTSNRAFAIGLAGGSIENTVAGKTLALSGAMSPASTLSGNIGVQLSGAGDGVISGIVSGAIAPTKSGAGTWTLSAANSYTGSTTVSGGILKIGNAKALGFGGTQTSSTGVTTVASGTTLDLNGVGGIINESITINGTGFGGTGALVNNSGTAATIGSGIAGLALPALGFGSSFSAVPGVIISGTGSGATATASLGITTASLSSVAGGTGWVTGDTVSITGGGGSGAVGVVTASAGSIRSITVTSPGYGFTSAPTSVTKLVSASGSGGTIVGNASRFTIGGLTLTNAGSGYTGTPVITIGTSAAPVTATLSSVNLATDGSIGGAGDITIPSAISGAGLVKVGTGKLTLAGANIYTGDTTIHGGTLKLDINGSISQSLKIVVGDAGSTGAHLDATAKPGGLTIGIAQTLKGIGQIDGSTTIAGTHAPGNSPGLQTFNGSLAYSAGSMVNWELATNSLGARGTDYDGVNVIGTGVLSIAIGVTANLIFNCVGSAVDWKNSFWFTNHSWMVFDGANQPIFASGRIFDTINVSNDAFGMTLTDGIFAWDALGDDVYLKFTAVPEPASLGTLTALGLLGIGTLRRKRSARR